MFRAVTFSSSGGQNCIITASGIVSLCKQPYSMQVESGLRSAVQLFTDSDDTRGCNNTVLSSWRWERYCSKHVEDYNVIYILLKNKESVH